MANHLQTQYDPCMYKNAAERFMDQQPVENVIDGSDRPITKSILTKVDGYHRASVEACSF